MQNKSPMTQQVSTTTILQLQEKSWEIYEYFAHFCDKYNLRFYGCGGCVIGAARNGKFIPWDDDVDVFMPRPDYERLAELWESEADTERFSYVRTSSTVHTGDVFTKICDNHTTLVTPYQVKKEIPQGLTIDIFPLDGAPRPKSLAWWWQMLTGLLFNLYNVGSAPKNHGKLIAFGSRILLAVAPTSHGKYKIWRWCEKQMSQWDYDSHEWTSRICESRRLMFTPFRRDWFGKGIDMPLEVAGKVRSYRMPDDYDTYLRTEFGDYLTPPPASNQQPKHSIHFIDLDTPYIEYMTDGKFDPKKVAARHENATNLKPNTNLEDGSSIDNGDFNAS